MFVWHLAVLPPKRQKIIATGMQRRRGFKVKWNTEFARFICSISFFKSAVIAPFERIEHGRAKIWRYWRTCNLGGNVHYDIT